MSEIQTGGCLCGAIRYQIRTPVTQLLQCHCTSCQKVSGAGASVNARVATADFELTRGEPKVYKDKADSGNWLYRSFCGDCGSAIHSRRELVPDWLTLKAGSLDDNSAATMAMNIWTRSARPWMLVDDQLPGHEKGPV